MVFDAIRTCIVAQIATATFVFFPQAATSQDAEGLRQRIEAHYTAIHAGDGQQVVSHHLDDISIFPWNGHALMERGWEDAAARMGAEVVGDGHGSRN